MMIYQPLKSNIDQWGTKWYCVEFTPSFNSSSILVNVTRAIMGFVCAFVYMGVGVQLQW